jgi:uncharacterized protein (DUF58 family)
MRTLTGRGRTLVAAGVAGTGAGWLLDEPAVTAVALFLILLPAIGAITVRRSRFALGSRREVSPTRITVGGVADVELIVENGSRFTTGLLLLEDTVPATLGSPAHLLLDRIPSGAQRSQRYSVTGFERGRARIGPLSVVITDPFGMATVTRSFASTSGVMVVPEIFSLGSGGATMTPGGHNDTMFRALAARGDDDLLPREHRPGDDIRHIHWRATARLGELMVRREEQAWHAAITIVLDDRISAHHGVGTSSTFEWAVTAAASIAMHFLRQGWRVTVLTTSGRVLVQAQQPSSAAIDHLMQAFADIRPIDAAMVPELGLDSDGTAAVVAVLGRLSSEDAQVMGRPVLGFAGCLLLDPGPEAHLRSQGWRVSCWHRGTSVAEAWSRIAMSAGVPR